MLKNEIIPLTVTAVSHEGDGIGRHDGMAVFVPMTAVGDVIEAKIVKVLKNRAYAIIHRVIKPSESRIENDCPVYRRCGGCSLRHIDYGRELEIKSNWVTENLRRIGGVNVTPDEALPSPRADRYRNKAQYPVRGIGGGIETGFFAKRSHSLIPIGDCLLQPVFFKDIVSEVAAFMNDFSLPPYDEVTNTGLVRHIFIRHAEASGEAMLCLVINGGRLPHPDALAERLDKSCPMIKTVAVNENRERTNVIFGGKTHTVAGSGFITDELCGVKVRLSAMSFYQVNRGAAERLYRAAFEYASPEKSDIVLDLYCGTGTIGLSMAGAVKQVIGVETVGAAILDARQNAAQNGITNARFIHSDAGEAVKRLRGEGVSPDIIVIDPPRKGMDEDMPTHIAALAPKKLVYISCNSATLARDAARLEPLGFKLIKARAVDLFPRTAHVECVALMVKQ